MVHFASMRHPATILDDLHGKVLNEAYQISKSTVADSVRTEVHRQEHCGSVRTVKISISIFSCSQNYAATFAQMFHARALLRDI